MKKQLQLRKLCVKTAHHLAYQAGFNDIMQKSGAVSATALATIAQPFGSGAMRILKSFGRGLGQWGDELFAPNIRSGTRMRATKRLMNPFYHMRHRYVPGHGDKSTWQTMLRMGMNPNAEDIAEVAGRALPTTAAGGAGLAGLTSAFNQE